MVRGRSILFPNLFPYATHSAVSLFDDQHHVEIGTGSLYSYRDCFTNCAAYLERVRETDTGAIYIGIAQNHLPSAGGSLLHPHLQVHADRVAPNHHRFLARRTRDYRADTGRGLFSDILRHEKEDGARVIGRTGEWEWLAAFAPEGFYEIWGILPGRRSLLAVEQEASCLELRVVLMVRSNYAAWVRNDHTSFETMLGDMATFHAPEDTARLAQPFWT